MLVLTITKTATHFYISNHIQSDKRPRSDQIETSQNGCK